ncbi:MAG: thioesterase family protein [Actinobacteria bacterium]|nr:thioesterase family protein [Actinomycetota bacterium]
MTDAADRLQRLLTLEPAGRDRFEAVTPSDGPGRLFGGQVAAQSLRAATLTVDGARPPHSFHAYFVRPGRPGTPLVLDVIRIRDGRSFTTRAVTATQGGEAIFFLAASFHAAEPGDDWQLPARDDVDGPGDAEVTPSPLARFESMMPFEIRPAAGRSAMGFALHPFWVRVGGTLPDDAALHACCLAFMSDMGVVGSALAPNATVQPFMGASLDHAVWFHRPARADEWLLFDVAPVSNFGARGLARGSMHTEDGALVASIAQEALLRPAGPTPLP